MRRREIMLGAAEVDDEVSALIETLHRTGQRLETLTAGEVDAVADLAGRSFLLQHAQDQVRTVDSLRQAAILNSLPANIALLDAQGVIVSVNEAWRRFAADNAPACPIHGVGVGVGADYLAVCNQAQGRDSEEAPQVAQGIRAVLSDESPKFSIEYPCHSPTEKRWFLLTVVPLARHTLGGAVVMHLDVTSQHEADDRLRTSQLHFRTLIESISDVITMTRADGVLTYISPSVRELAGYEPQEMLGHSLLEFLHPDDQAQGLKAVDEVLQAPGALVHSELRFRHADGSWLMLESIAKNLLHVPDIEAVVVTVRNVTERHEAGLKIRHLNRVYAVLSGINTLIVRIRERAELFDGACRIAVEQGGFRMALIGIIDHATGKVVPVASAGKDQALLGAIEPGLSLLEGAPRSMVARAIREQKSVVSNRSRDDPQVLFGWRYAEAGVNSIAVLPLLIAGESVGILALYARELEFFRDDEMKLLSGLADDVAFAIDHLDQQERIEYLAYYDVLTGLANRSLFLERVAQFMRSAAGGGHKLALYLIDLEGFKAINDSLGRPAGDALLRQVAEWLTRELKDVNLLARVGSDHFAAVLPVVWHERDVAQFLETLLNAFLAHNFHLDTAEFRVGAKVGVALFPDDGTIADALFTNAEAAMKKTKASGQRFLFYAPKMTEAVARRLQLENQLRQALEQREFVLHYQPKINLASGKLSGAEALIRWNHPREGLVLPGQFIPILEQAGLIHAVGLWALHQAISDYQRWCDLGFCTVRIAVNVSPMQLRRHDFVEELARAVSLHANAAAGLELEITESLIMEDVAHSITSLKAIREMGICVAIDDFGTGFSSLSYLSRLPLDALKIDRSFITDMTSTPEALALVSTIINLAHSLKLQVVAEGVETDEQSRLLRRLNCDHTQGFLFSKAVPVDVFEAKFLERLAPAS